MKATSYILAVILLMATSRATAQPIAPEGSQLVTHQGVTGMWFPMEAARRLLDSVEQLSPLRDQVDRLEGRVQLDTEMSSLLRENLLATQQQADHWRQSLNAVAAQSRPHRPAVWESPTFWFFAGFVSSAVMAIGLAFGIQPGGS